MRVLHIDTGREMRGGQYQMRMLVDGLRRQGVPQTVLANAAAFFEDDRSFRDARPVSWPSIRRQARQADIIHAHDARAHTLAVVHGAGKPVVVSRRVAFPIKTGFLSRWKYSRAAYYLAVSRFVAAQLTAAGIPADKISVVYDAVQAVRPARPEARGERPFQVLTHALEDPRKGGALMAAACREVGLTPSFATDLSRDLPAADVFVYLSESEGLGSAILLAMACDTPVVASAVGGIPEIVSHEKTGLLVENNAASVAASLRRLQDDPALARRLAAAARGRVIAEFSDTRMVRETLGIYERILGLASQP